MLPTARDAASHSQRTASTPPGQGVVTLLTDFGQQDGYVGAMTGAVLQTCPHARVVHITHTIPPQDIRAAAFCLRQAVPHFPRGTTHVAVVDPEVGTARPIIAVRAGGHHFIGPDNGILDWSLQQLSCEQAVQLPAAHDALGLTFQGRDVMAPAAGLLASGTPLERLGTPYTWQPRFPWPHPERDAGGWHGSIVHVDRFGNCITNIDQQHLDEAATWQLTIGDHMLNHVRTYADAPQDQPIWLVGGEQLVEVAVKSGSAAGRLRVGAGDPVYMTRLTTPAMGD